MVKQTLDIGLETLDLSDCGMVEPATSGFELEDEGSIPSPTASLSLSRKSAFDCLCHNELFVMFKPFEYVTHVIHWFQTSAKSKLHN